MIETIVLVETSKIEPSSVVCIKTHAVIGRSLLSNALDEIFSADTSTDLLIENFTAIFFLLDLNYMLSEIWIDSSSERLRFGVEKMVS